MSREEYDENTGRGIYGDGEDKPETARREAQHTPGPWRTEGWKNLIVNAADGSTILACPGGHTLEELQANARLIAAAPELVEALEALFEHCAMIHSRWGDNSNSREATAAKNTARVLLARIREGA